MRLKPAPSRYVRLNYLASAQQFVSGDDGAFSFRRWKVDLDHEIFHCVYELGEKPQVPAINAFLSGQHTERWDAPEANYRAIYDDQGRPQVIICHNTDLGDGWEREGENIEYFRQMSEPKAYPLGINILFYAMTH